MKREIMLQSLPKAAIRQLFMAAAAVLLCSCAATSVKTTWKAPDYAGGPARKVAVLAVEERGMYRQALENRFVNQLKAKGQEALVTHELLSLPSIKEDKKAAAASVKQAGADCILIMHLVDRTTYDREVRATSADYVPVTTGMDSYGWYDYYSLAFMDMGAVWHSLEQNIFLDTGLYDLGTGKRLWSCLTETRLREEMDKLEVADALVAKVLAAARKDGVVR
jgi:hypothetical protein